MDELTIQFFTTWTNSILPSVTVWFIELLPAIIGLSIIIDTAHDTSDWIP